jgi:hypothetical protein
MWDKASQMMNSINLNGLSPGEQNAVERSLNQSNTATGNLGLDNATNTVSNAMNFGNAYQQKLGQMANAINSGAQAFGTGQQITGTGSNLINLGGNLYNSAGQQLGAAGQQLGNAANIYGAGAGQYGQASNMLGQSAGTLGQAGNLYGNAQSGIGQMGNLYGQAGQLGTQGISNATNILGAANQTATSAQNTGWNPINLAIGQPNASTMGNFGTGTFSNTSANTQNASGQNAFGFGQGLMGNMSSMNNAFTGAAAQQAAANTGAMGQMASAGIGAACCWIFMEAYKGLMPKFVRSSRDWYYVAKPDMATGYRRVASWLVPAMRHSATVRWLVWNLMVSPITQYLGAVNKQKGYKRTAWNKAVTRFWLTSWTKLGKGHTEAEYLKPWMTKIA